MGRAPSRWTLTISHPEPSGGDSTGLQFFVRRKFAEYGFCILEFMPPTYGTLNTDGREFRLIHLRFVVALEGDDDRDHCREFRLSPARFQERNTQAVYLLDRVHDFADAEEAFYAQDKETRGSFKTVRDKNGKGMVELVHTENEDPRKERFWKVKLVRERPSTRVLPTLR
jgi:hypothetical protein